MINFICSADWAKGSPDSWKTSLGMSVRVFPEEISLWISKLNKADGPPQWRRASSIPQGPVWNKKTKERQILYLLELEHPSPLSSDVGSPGSWAFRLWEEALHQQTPPLCPSSQAFRLNYTTGFAGSLACWLPILGLLSLHNFMGQLLQWIFSYICLYILLVLILWRALTNTSTFLIGWLANTYNTVSVCHLLNLRYIILYNCSSKQRNSMHRLILSPFPTHILYIVS